MSIASVFGYMFVAIAATAVLFDAFIAGLACASIGAFLLQPFQSAQSAFGIMLLVAGVLIASASYPSWPLVLLGLVLIALGFRLSEHLNKADNWVSSADDVIQRLRSTLRRFDVDE